MSVFLNKILLAWPRERPGQTETPKRSNNDQKPLLITETSSRSDAVLKLDEATILNLLDRGPFERFFQ